jgi:hypothetical protein
MSATLIFVNVSWNWMLELTVVDSVEDGSVDFSSIFGQLLQKIEPHVGRGG